MDRDALLAHVVDHYQNVEKVHGLYANIIGRPRGTMPTGYVDKNEIPLGFDILGRGGRDLETLQMMQRVDQGAGLSATLAQFRQMVIPNLINLAYARHQQEVVKQPADILGK